jgi:hypothetical protein
MYAQCCVGFERCLLHKVHFYSHAMYNFKRLLKIQICSETFSKSWFHFDSVQNSIQFLNIERPLQFQNCSLLLSLLHTFFNEA